MAVLFRACRRSRPQLPLAAHRCRKACARSSPRSRTQLTVKRCRMLGNGMPAKYVGHTLASSLPHAFSQRGVLEQFIHITRQIADKLVMIAGGAKGASVVLEGHQCASNSWDNNFRYAADGGGHHRYRAGHRFQIDDSKGLIHAGAYEYSRMRQELGQGIALQHSIDPDDVASSSL